MTEDDLAETVDLEPHRVREPGQPVHVVLAELLRRPRGDRVAHVVDLTAGQLDQFPVRVAPHPGDPVTEPEQPVKHLHRLGTGRDVPGEHDALGTADGGLGQHRVKRG